MCGIVGYWPINPTDEVGPAFTRLFEQSTIRGKHAYGIASPDGVLRSFRWEAVPQAFLPDQPQIAHSRYCQSGDWRVMENNQPLLAGGCALAFNGCIDMSTKAEFEARWGVECDTDNDGEIFIRKCLIGNEKAEDWLGAIQGSFAGVWLQNGKIFAGRNSRRPLWRCFAYGARWYASTADILKRAGFPEGTELAVGVEQA